MAVPDHILDGIGQLKPLPVTVQRLSALLGREDVAPSRIADIVEYDGAVAANILRAANSPVFGGAFRITRLRDAVVRLGTTALFNIILGEHLKTLMVAAPFYDLTENDLWKHGAAASLAVQAMTRAIPHGTIPEIASVAALIHDIGKLIMVRYLKADITAIVSLCEEKNLTFVEAERELIECDHAEVGAAVGRKWGFPEAITRAMEMHHRVPVPDPEPILDAVMLANLAAKSAGIGLGYAGLNMKIDYSGSMERLSLTIAGFERACAQTALWAARL